MNSGVIAFSRLAIKLFVVFGCSKMKKISPKFLFIAYDVWKQSEKAGGD
jgi:hypothetical protein